MSELNGAEESVWAIVERDVGTGPRPNDDPYRHTGNGPYDIEKDDMPKPYNERLRESGETITDTVVEKNLAYGDAINKVATIMMVLFPNGIQPRQYMDMLLLVRDLDKTCRIADGDPTAFGESPWKDKAGYGICGMAVHSE